VRKGVLKKIKQKWEDFYFAYRDAGGAGRKSHLGENG